MPCYEPLLMVDTGMINPDTGKHVMEFRGRALTLQAPDNPDREFLYTVPCNHCIGCRLDYARQWSNRMLLELLDHKDALFITLTYNNEHLPLGDKCFPTVNVRDCQLFMKRLRQHFKDKKLRFYLSSEYGPRRGRPHYHLILYGLGMHDFPDMKFLKYNKLKQPLYFSNFFAESIWQNGFCVFGAVSRDTCSYTARYMLKKFKGKKASYYEERGIKPEFSLSSRRPGIGMNYFEKHPEFCSTISVFDGNETISFPMPKKLFDKLLDVDPDVYYQLKAARRETAYVNNYLEWQKSDMEYLEYLDMKETEIYERIKGISSQTRLDI